MKAGTGVGFLSKQTAFAQRHSLFFERFGNLNAAINAAYDRTITADGPLDPVIFYLGFRTVDDFEAIVVVAANDIALPAQGLIRGMYERVVTMAHLHDNPGDVSAFVDFDTVQRCRAARNIKDTIGLSPEQEASFKELENEYEKIKSQFEVACPKCGVKRVGPSWSKLDFVTMAKKLPRFADLVGHAYSIPLLQAHSTLKSATARLHEKDGKLALQMDHAALSDEVFRLAHLLLLHSLYLQAEHFKNASIESAVELAMSDYMAMYPTKPDTDEPPPNSR